MPNNLYPPIVDTYTPAFETSLSSGKRTGSCRIYFNLSPYNKEEDVGIVWVSLVNSVTNETIFKNRTEMVGIKELKKANSSNNPDLKYCVEIGEGSLQDPSWDLNTLYKAQIRFSPLIGVDGNEIVPGNASNINKNIELFSEWSTATLVKPIAGESERQITYHRMEPEDTHWIFNAYDNTFSGTIGYGPSEVTGEVLDSFQLKIYKSSPANWTIPDELIYDSGVCFTDELDVNTFSHKITTGLVQGKYVFRVTFTSNNLFIENKDLWVYVRDTGKGSLNAKFAAEPDPDNGRMKLTAWISGGNFVGNLVIRRSSHESDFSYWEDFKIVQINIPNNSNTQVFEWFDNTVDSGMIYQYYITQLLESGERRYSAFTEPTLMILKDIFINGNGRQLKVKFDPNIGSYQHTILDSSQQAIGSKYPFIKRNGQVNYRQIGISGLLTYQMDIEEGYGTINGSLSKPFEWDSNELNLFTSKESLLNGYADIFKKFNSENSISPQRDFILERKFREEVTEFLLDGKAKLFRSPTEKAAIVRLMNVSVSPHQGTTRMLYTFSATGHEIADCSLDNINKYGIEEKGFYEAIRGKDLFRKSATASTVIPGPVDYFRNQSISIVNLLDLPALAPPSSNKWKGNKSFASNVKISIYSDAEHKILATGYKINGNPGDNSLTLGDSSSSTTGFIVYYENYMPGSVTRVKNLYSSSAEYSFSADSSLTFLSIAVPEGQTFYVKVTADITGFETAIEESFILGKES